MGGRMSVAERYVEAVNNADTHGLLALFAEDATLAHPVGTDQGHTEIADFHTDVIFAGQVRMTLSRNIEHGNIEVAQLESTSPLNEDTTVFTVDIFTLNDDGLVQTLDIYYR
jgi:predicted SnoaL-like aldol condensation-catalyzing enzyme